LCEEIGATYDSTAEISVADSTKKYGEYDLIFECTGLFADHLRRDAEFKRKRRFDFSRP
jgi:hypothetical protein